MIMTSAQAVITVVIVIAGTIFTKSHSVEATPLKWSL